MAAKVLNTSSADIGGEYMLFQALHKFSCMLTANDNAAQDLMRRAGLLQESPRIDPLKARKHLHSIWTARLRDRPDLAQSFPPDIRLFAQTKASGADAASAHFSKFVAYMPWRQRIALYLVYGERFSYDEAADVTSLSMLGFMKRLTNGHATLASWMDRQTAATGFEPTAGMERAA